MQTHRRIIASARFRVVDRLPGSRRPGSSMAAICPWACALAFAIAIQPANASLIVSNNAFGAIQGGGAAGTSVFFQHDFTEPVATVNSGTVSGRDSGGHAYSGITQATVNSSDLGDLRLSGSASGTGFVETTADAAVDVKDGLHFDNPALTGQAAIANVGLFVDGDWAGSVIETNAAFAGFQLFYTLEFWKTASNQTTRTALMFSNSLEYETTIPVTCHERINAGSSMLGPCTGLFQFQLPIVIGTPFYFEYDFIVDSDTTVSNANAVGNVSFDFSHSLLWGGISSVTVGGDPISYTFSSDSGYDWRQSRIPTSQVPEPTSLALLALGVAALALKRRPMHPGA